MRSQSIVLKPHDVCVALQIALEPEFVFRQLADRVGLSLGEAHNSVKRLEAARLFLSHHRVVQMQALQDLLVSGVPYVFPGTLGPEARGIPTAHSGPLMADLFASEETIVWPSPDGRARGASLLPLCPSAPSFAQENPRLYSLLTVIDAIRIGRARERQIGKEILERELAATKVGR